MLDFRDKHNCIFMVKPNTLVIYQYPLELVRWDPFLIVQHFVASQIAENYASLINNTLTLYWMIQNGMLDVS